MNYALLAALAVYGSALWVAGFLYGRMWELHNPTPTWHRRSPNGRAR